MKQEFTAANNNKDLSSTNKIDADKASSTSLQHLGDNIKDAAVSVGDKMGVNLKDVDFAQVKDRAVEGIKGYTGRAASFLSERPLASIAIAAAAGFGLACFVRGRD